MFSSQTMRVSWFSGLTFVLFLGLCSCNATSQNTSGTLTVLGSSTSLSALTQGLALKAAITPPVGGAGAPSSLTIKLFALYVSPNADCSDAVLVHDYGDSGSTIDMFSSPAPTLFSDSVANGTYHCVVLKIGDVLSFQPNATAAAAFPGSCSQTETYTGDIYRADSDPTPWHDINGNPIVGHGTDAVPVEDQVYIFSSTDVTVLLAGPLGVSENQSLSLTGSLIVNGATSSTFNVDGTNYVVGANSTCGLEGVAMSFIP